MSYTMTEWNKLNKQQRKEAGFSNAPGAIKVTTILIFATLIFFVVLIFKSCSTSTPEKPLSHNEQMIKAAEGQDYQAQQLVKSHLNFPLIAEFNYNDKFVLDAEDSTNVICEGSVVSKNAFGVPIETKYQVLIKVEGDKAIPYKVNLYK
jgi:hypothetical protein